MSLSEPVSGFSAIDVTCGGYRDSSETKAQVVSFTMVHPEAYDTYYMTVPSSSNPLISYLEVSSDGKTLDIPSSTGNVNIFRVVGHR